jgi:hypothetical protein
LKSNIDVEFWKVLTTDVNGKASTNVGWPSARADRHLWLSDIRSSSIHLGRADRIENVRNEQQALGRMDYFEKLSNSGKYGENDIISSRKKGESFGDSTSSIDVSEYSIYFTQFETSSTSTPSLIWKLFSFRIFKLSMNDSIDLKSPDSPLSIISKTNVEFLNPHSHAQRKSRPDHLKEFM